MAPNSATGSLLRDELLNGEIFSTFKEAQIVIEAWLARCNKLPHQRLLQRPGLGAIAPLGAYSFSSRPRSARDGSANVRRIASVGERCYARRARTPVENRDRRTRLFVAPRRFYVRAPLALLRPAPMAWW